MHQLWKNGQRLHIKSNQKMRWKYMRKMVKG